MCSRPAMCRWSRSTAADSAVGARRASGASIATSSKRAAKSTPSSIPIRSKRPRLRAPGAAFRRFTTWWPLPAAPTSAVLLTAPSALKRCPTRRSRRSQAVAPVCSPIMASSRSAPTLRARSRSREKWRTSRPSIVPRSRWVRSGTLDATKMARVVEKFRTYGRQDVAEPGLAFGGIAPPPAAGH